MSAETFDEAIDSRARPPSRAFDALVGSAGAMRKLRALLPVLAASSAPVLIRGETGAGKEVVARALHELGPRARAPFVAINCASVPSALFESELFGHEQGSFTGAYRRARGRLEEAGEGTLLLDEVGDMPLEQQAKLLRAMSERRFRAVGGDRDLPFPARVLAATHVDLEARVARGEFRSDLFFRLNVLNVRVPSLAQRKGDLFAIAQHCLREITPSARITEEAAAFLSLRAWPGNVRELRSVLERAEVLAAGGEITLDLLRRLETLFDSGASVSTMEEVAARVHALPGTLHEKLAALEEQIIRQALSASAGNQAEAARLLGVHRKWLERRVHARIRAKP